jgi:hypothetical protein
MTEQTPVSTGCCPPFDPVPWDGKEITWQNKLFIRDTFAQFMHIPLPGAMARTVTRMWTKIEAAGAKPDDRDFLMLAFDPSPWKSELYMSVTREVPDAENVRLSGTYLVRVFDGPYNAVPKWMAEMETYAAQRGDKIKKQYFLLHNLPEMRQDLWEKLCCGLCPGMNQSEEAPYRKNRYNIYFHT